MADIVQQCGLRDFGKSLGLALKPFRLVAVYAQEGDAIRLVHFQSTMLPAGMSATPNEAS
jgi:hypothetical protein